MKDLFVLILVGVTSLTTIRVGVRALGLSGTGLRPAIGKMLESVGISLLFYMLNLTVGMAAVLAIRLITRQFLSLYLAADATLPVLSLLQGLAFQWWRERQARPGDSG